jgi:hypothetical protein
MQGWLFDRPDTKEEWRKLYEDFDWYAFDDDGYERETRGLPDGRTYQVQVRSVENDCIYARPEGFAHVAVCTSGALNIAAYGVPYVPRYGETPHRAVRAAAGVVLEKSLAGFLIGEWNDLGQQTADKVVKHLRTVARGVRSDGEILAG